MHTATSHTRQEVLDDIIRAQEEFCWYREEGGGGTATAKRCFNEKMAFDLDLEGQQEEKGVGGGHSGVDHISDSRKLRTHRCSWNWWVYRECHE